MLQSVNNNAEIAGLENSAQVSLNLQTFFNSLISNINDFCNQGAYNSEGDFIQLMITQAENDGISVPPGVTFAINDFISQSNESTPNAQQMVVDLNVICNSSVLTPQVAGETVQQVFNLLENDLHSSSPDLGNDIEMLTPLTFFGINSPSYGNLQEYLDNCWTGTQQYSWAQAYPMLQQAATDFGAAIQA